MMKNNQQKQLLLQTKAHNTQAPIDPSHFQNEEDEAQFIPGANKNGRQGKERGFSYDNEDLQRNSQLIISKNSTMPSYNAIAMT